MIHMTAVQELNNCIFDLQNFNSVKSHTEALEQEIATEGFITNTLRSLWELIKRALAAIQRFWYVTIKKDPDELIRNYKLEPAFRRAFDESQKILKEVRGIPWDDPEWANASKKIHEHWVKTREEMRLLLAQNANDRFYKKMPNDNQIVTMIRELEKLGNDCRDHAMDSVTSNRQNTAVNLLSAHGIAMECRAMMVFKKRNQFLGTAGVSNVTASYM